jgi:hypothetical protein
MVVKARTKNLVMAFSYTKHTQSKLAIAEAILKLFQVNLDDL